MSNGFHILIADDDLVSNELLKAILIENGFSVTSFTNGKSALEELDQSDQYAVAILDWTMPELSGVEICQYFKVKESLDTFFLLLTSKYGIDDLVTGLEAGAHEYMQKPCDPEELIARIHVGIRHYVTLQQRNKTACLMEKLAEDRANELILAKQFFMIGAVSNAMNEEENESSTFVSEEVVADVKITKKLRLLEKNLITKINEFDIALKKLKSLDGNITHCQKCNAIRDDKQFWDSLEKYISNPFPEDFQSGICPNCMEKQFKIGGNCERFIYTNPNR